MSEAFPRRLAPRHVRPDAVDIEEAKTEFALHIPSLFTRECIAPGCEEEWPCRRRRHSAAVLDRAGLIDIDGRLRL